MNMALNMNAARVSDVKFADLIAIGLGLGLMYIPTLIKLDQTVWNVVGQGHGPVMLALTIWLAWQRWESLSNLSEADGRPVAGSVLLATALLLHTVGYSQELLMFDVISIILALAGLILIYRGFPGLRHMWFPLFFMLFLIPLPGIIVATLTGPLKAAVSYVAEAILYHLGYPIGRTGVTLTIGPYQLMVADACAGLNSVFALEAVGVFYMSVVGYANRARNMLLALLILPISFISNVIRVMALVLITYYLGDEVGQGFVHDFAGILLFMVATLLTVSLDSLLGLYFNQPADHETNLKTTAKS
jgi:exosortase B